MRALLVVGSLLAAAFASGCADDAPNPPALPGPDAAGVAAPAAVVAFIDTGINPYHATFRDSSPRAFQHPSTYLPGYPSEAVALELTFSEDDWEDAVDADCKDVWSTVQPETLYWFPGTKIVGAVYLGGEPGADCGETNSVHGILDYGGHGTMVASRGASTEYGACAQCLVVAVQGFTTESLLWTASHSAWIDAQSNSWGPFLPVPGPSDESGTTGNLVDTPEFTAAVELAAQAHLAFWATGNGALTRLGVLGHPTLIDPRMTPSIVMVGGHDSGYVNTWPDFPPHVVSDSCNSWAAYADSMDESAEDVGGGTSGATPYAAGGAARILLEARAILGDLSTGVHEGVAASGPAGLVPDGPLADGNFTLAEWKELVFKTATERPVQQHEDGSVCDVVGGLGAYSATPVMWKDVPDDYPEYVHIGYGAVDNASRAVAFSVLQGQGPLPDRMETDAYFAQDAEARQRFYETYQSMG